MDGIGEFVGPVGTMIIIAWIVKISLAHRRFNKVVDVQADHQSKLLDKFGSSQELIDYLRSDPGTRFVEAMETASTERTTPYSRIFSSLQWGIILGLAGAAFLFIDGRISDGDPGFFVIGALGVPLGVGFLLSGAAAFPLSKSWGLINGNQDRLQNAA